MSATGAQAGKQYLYTFSSVSSATPFTSPAQYPNWCQVIGAGSTVVVDESGNSITITTDAAEPDACIPGPFTAFTSTTATRVRMGQGPMPPIAVPASAVPATTTAVGGVKLSVAPASAASPIAAGTNDTRLTTKSVPMFVVQADGTLAESTVWIPGVACTITGATLSAPAAITQSDTNYLTFTVSQRDGAGGSASTIASKSTQVTGGGAFLAFQALSLGSLTNTSVAAGAQVTFKSVKTSAGQAVAGLLHLNVTYTVP